MSTYSSVILADSPVAYYRLNESSGTTATDATSNHYNATLKGTVTYSQSGAISGDSDKALAFDANGGLSLPYNLNPSSFSALTLEYWINVSGTWKHIVVTSDNSSGITTLYLNGNVYNPDTTGEVILTEKDLYFSGSPSAATLDEVAIYNTVLSSSQIQYHFLVGSGALVPLTLYNASVGSSVLGNAELLISVGGGSQGSSQSTNIGSHTQWIEVGFGAGNSWAGATSIQPPDGTGAFFDGNSLVGKQILAGNYSATLTFNLDQAGKQITGDATLRFYKYNSSTSTYTAIGSITKTGVTVTSSVAAVNFPSTNLPLMAFNANESLYVDCWMNLTSNTMISGGHILNYESNSSTLGWTGSQFVTPGYQTQASQMSGTDTLSIGSEIDSITDIFVPTETLALAAENDVLTLAVALNDVLTLIDTSTMIAVPIGIAGVDQLAINDSASSFVLASNLSDTTAPGTDRLAQVIPSTFQDDALTASDSIAQTLAANLADNTVTSDAPTSTLAVSFTDSLTENSSMTFWSQPLFLNFTDGLLTPSDLGFFYPRRRDMGYTLLALDSFSRASVGSGLGTASDTNIWQYLPITGTNPPSSMVSGNQGFITNGSTDSPYVLGSSSQDGEVVVRFTPSDTGDTFGVMARTTFSSGSLTAYKLIFYTGGIHLNKTVANSTTEMTAVAFSITANSSYWLRFRLQGNNLYGKIWASGSAEPAAWTTTTADSAITGGGQTGILVNSATGSNAVGFDKFFAVDNLLIDAVSALDASAFGATRALDPDTAAPDDSITPTVGWTFTDQLTLTGESLSNAIPWPLVDVPLNVAESLKFTNSANQGWLTLGLDTFVRSNVSGSWGTATDGNTWSVATGSATQSVNANEGQLTGVTTLTFMRLGSASAADAEALARVNIPSTSVTAVGVALRLNGNTAYRCRINAQTSSQGFGIVKTISGTSTNISLTSFTASTSNNYWIRFRVQGSNLYGKVWQDGTVEPSAWTITTTDTGITGAGGVGLVALSGTSGDTFKFDHFNAFDNALADNALIESEYFLIQQQALENDSTPETELLNASLATTFVLPFAPEVLNQSEVDVTTVILRGVDTLSPTDSLDYTNPPFGLAEISQLTISESSSFAVSYQPIEQLTEVEAVLETEVFPTGADSLTNTETQLFVGTFRPTDQLTTQDSVAQTNYSAIPAETAGILSDKILAVIKPVAIDSVTSLDSRADSLAYSAGDSLSLLSETLEYGVPSNFMDDVTPVQPDTLFSALAQVASESNVEAESVIFLEAGNYLEAQLTNAESHRETISANLSEAITYAAAILADAPVAYYRLNEVSGTVALDQTSNHYNATLRGTVSYVQAGAITGDNDTALGFDANGGLSLPYSLNPSSFSALTLEYWINVSGTWQHVVITTDNSSGVTSHYLNGLPYTLNTSGDIILTEQDLYFSGTPGAAKLDEVAIYNTVLSPFQIRRHYLIGTGTQSFAPLQITDTVIASVPANLNDTALNIVETGSFGDGNRYDLGVDQLSITDNLFVRDNFTDTVAVQESLSVRIESTTLEPRSVLYSNIIADHPSAYWQLNEDVFAGIFQHNGQDQPNNASSPYLLGATLEYTWSQIEPEEGNLLWDIIDADILPWSNQAKSVIIRVYTASTPFHNSLTYLNNTAGQATPQWVFDAGAPAVTGLDGAVYPVYWNTVYQQKYATFIQELANRYDTNANVAAVVIACGVNGTTQLEASGDSPANTVALWTPRGYTPQTWVNAIQWTVATYQNNFLHTSLILSVNDAFIQPDNIFNIDQCVSLAVADGVWLMDENVYVGEAHTNPNWHVVPLISVPRKSAASGGDSVAAQLVLESNYQSDYAAVWHDDITGGANNTILAKYAGAVIAKKLTDSATGNYVLPTYGGVYPTAHIETGDYLNGAQQFNGLSGYAMLPAVPQTTTSAWTLKASVFPTVLPTQESIIVCNGRGGDIGAGGYALGVSGGSSGGAGSNFCVYLPGIGWYDSGYAFPAINQWYALFATWDGTTLKFYVNGVQTPNTYSISPLAVPTNVTIGALWDGFTRTATKLFIGSIDEVAIYPTALSPSRIATLSNIEIGLIESAVGSAGTIKVTDTLTVSDSASNVTGVQSLNDPALTVSDLIAFSISYVTQQQPTVLGWDNFNRLDQSGWGTANDGQTWTISVGSPSLSIVSNQAKFTNTAVGCTMLLGSATGTQEEGLLSFSISATGAPGVGLVLRATDGNNCYRARLSSTNLAIVKVAGGTATNLVTSSFTYSINTVYWIRFKAQATNLQAKIWADGSAEPVAWTLTTTDATYSSGKIGIFSQLNASNNFALFDNFFVVDNPLTDQMRLDESFAFTSILPPFIDSNTVLETSILIDNPTVIDILTESESNTITGKVTSTDFLQETSRQAWQEAVSLNDVALSTSETLLTPVAREIDDDPLAVIDASTFVAGGGGGGQIAPSDSQSYVISESLSEQLTLTDASKITYERIFVDQLSTSDSSNFTGVFLEVTQLQFVENITATERFVPVDTPALVEKLQASVAHQDTDAVNIADGMVPTERFLPIDTTLVAEDINPYFAVSLVWNNPPATSDSIQVVTAAFGEDDAAPDDAIEVDTALALPYDVQIPAETIVITSEGTGQDIVSSQDVLRSVVAQTQIDQCNIVDALLNNSSVRSADSLFTAEFLSVVEANNIGDVTSLSDAILSIVAQSWITQTNTTSDSIGFTDNWLRVDQLASVERLVLALSEAQTDMVLPAESEIASIFASYTDSVSPTEQGKTTVAAFFTNDLVITSDFAFAVVYQSFSDGLSVVETGLTTLNNRASDSLTSTSPVLRSTLSYQVTDTLNSVSNIKESLALTFAADTASLLDVSGAMIATSFTGWTDLLKQAERAQFAEGFVPSGTGLETESFTVSTSEILHEISTPATESAAYGLSEYITETSHNIEILVPIIAPQDVNALQNFEFVVFRVEQAERNTLPETEQASFSILAVPTEQLTQREILLATERLAQNDPALSIAEGRVYTTIMAPVETLLEQERLVLALAAAFTETTPAGDIAPSVGYALTPDTLVLSEKLNYTRTEYEVVTGVINTGAVTGRVLTGEVTGVILTGSVEGIIP